MDTTADSDEKKKAQQRIIELTGQVQEQMQNIEEFFILDELIQKNIKKILDKK